MGHRIPQACYLPELLSAWATLAGRDGLACLETLESDLTGLCGVAVHVTLLRALSDGWRSHCAECCGPIWPDRQGRPKWQRASADKGSRARLERRGNPFPPSPLPHRICAHAPALGACLRFLHCHNGQSTLFRSIVRLYYLYLLYQPFGRSATSSPYRFPFFSLYQPFARSSVSSPYRFPFFLPHERTFARAKLLQKGFSSSKETCLLVRCTAARVMLPRVAGDLLARGRGAAALKQPLARALTTASFLASAVQV